MNVETHNKKQVTSTSSTLIRSVVFRPKLAISNGSHSPIPVGQEIASSQEREITLTALRVALELEEDQEVGGSGEGVVTNGPEIMHEILHERIETFAQTNGSVAV